MVVSSADDDTVHCIWEWREMVEERLRFGAIRMSPILFKGDME